MDPSGAARQPTDGAIQAAQQRVRAGWFVGRERELSGFTDLLAARDTPRVVFVHGPGGIGKSSLLEAFRDAARRLDLGYEYLDARLLPARPDAIAQTVENALSDAHVGQAGRSARVLALDHAEQLSALDGWMRVELLPNLPADLVLILAGRQRPGPEWRADPGLGSLLIDYELGPLEPDAVSRYLQRRGVPVHQQSAVRDFARGHPLALALSADRVLRESEKPFDATASPDLIHDLMTWLLRDVDEPRRLEALAACATVRSLNEPLLAAMLDRDDVREEFDWLADQHFVDRHATGLVIHDLVREVVVHDLRGRNLELHHNLIRRAAAHLLGALEGAGERAALSAVGDTIYTLRHEPYVKRQFPFHDARCYPDSAGAEEIPALKAEVARLEGNESAAWFEHWLSREGTELLVMRDSARQPVAMAATVRFDRADVAARSDDPCVQALFRYLRRHAPLRGNEQVMLLRSLLAHNTHQARTPVWAELTAQLNGLMFTPGISVLAWVSDLSYDWENIGDTADAWLLPDSEFRIGGRRYAITAHDARREPPLEWARNSVERILRDGDAPELRPAEVVLLDEAAFEDAVMQALHAFHDEAALARNPLLHAPLLRRHSTRRDPDALRKLIRETSAARLATRQHPCSLHDVLDRVYFRPAGKQQAAAADLHVSERTLRRRLREAESLLVDALWELETGSA